MNILLSSPKFSQSPEAKFFFFVYSLTIFVLWTTQKLLA